MSSRRAVLRASTTMAPASSRRDVDAGFSGQRQEPGRYRADLTSNTLTSDLTQRRSNAARENAAAK